MTLVGVFFLPYLSGHMLDAAALDGACYVPPMGRILGAEAIWTALGTLSASHAVSLPSRIRSDALLSSMLVACRRAQGINRAASALLPRCVSPVMQPVCAPESFSA